MSRLRWFRVGCEARGDNRLRALADDEFRVWFNLLCLAVEADEGGIIPPMDPYLLAAEVAGGDEDLVERAAAKLIRLHILCRGDDGSLRFITFDKHDPRQLPRRPRSGTHRLPLRPSIRVNIFARDRYRCRYCGATSDLTIDHVIPLARGGSNDTDNLVTACRRCNTSKGARTPDEWLRNGAQEE